VIREPSARESGRHRGDIAIIAIRQLATTRLLLPSRNLERPAAASARSPPPSPASRRAIALDEAIAPPEDGTLRSADELRGVFEQAGVTEDKALITYCTIGNRAAEARFALKCLLGYRDVRVYYGSWVEWGKATDTPIET
jgi:rhodanese-related sulfurtransferase